MRRSLIRRSSFAAAAKRVAAVRTSLEEEEVATPPKTAAVGVQFTFSNPVVNKPWLDDMAHKEAAVQAHRASPEYQELHRGSFTNSDMGLFGGERGFEVSPRTWVDPDNPTIPHIFNVTALSKNLRYARYGYFKSDLQIIDMDKLVRHARMLPGANKLLMDCVSQRASLDDAACAAILMHSYRCLMSMSHETRQPYFRDNVEMVFERMLITSIPPVEVGVAAHAAAIRCCALAGRFEEGYNGYRAHAVEEANRVTDILINRGGEPLPSMERSEAENPLLLSAEFFDAILELCNACGRFEEGLKELHAAILSGRRLFTATLDKALIACAYLRRPVEAEDVWSLYAFYERTPTAQSFECLAACLGRNAGTSMNGVVNLLPTYFATALAHFKNAAVIKNNLSQNGWDIQRVTPLSYCWIFNAWAQSDLYGRHKGNDVVSLLASMATSGDAPTEEVLVYALQYCAARPEDGAETALEVLRLYLRKYQINPNFEMALLMARAFAASEAPTPVMLHEIMAVVETMKQTTGDNTAQTVEFGAYDSESDVAQLRKRQCYPFEMVQEPSHFDAMAQKRRDAEGALLMALLTLASRVGASAEAFTLLSAAATTSALSRHNTDTWIGVPPYAFNLALVANAMSAPGPSASHRVTQDVLELYFATSTGELTRELIDALSLCRQAHGPFPDSLSVLLDSSGVEDAQVSLLDLVDAQAGFIDLYADEQPEEVARVKRCLGDLKSDVDHASTRAATRPWLADPFTRHRNKTSIDIDAKRIKLKTLGQATRKTKEHDRESSREALDRWVPFPDDRNYRPVD